MKIDKLFLYAHVLLHNVSKGELFGSDIKDHLGTIVEETMLLKPKVIVELGVRKGESTNAIAQAARMFDSDFYSVDLDDCSKVCNYSKWHFIKSDSVKAAKDFSKRVDFLFIDTNHEYKQTKKEIDAWFPLLSDNATIIFHDTNKAELYERNDGTLGVGEGSDRDVIRAIEEHFNLEFTETKDFRKKVGGHLFIHFKNSNGLLIIRKEKK